MADIIPFDPSHKDKLLNSLDGVENNELLSEDQKKEKRLLAEGKEQHLKMMNGKHAFIHHLNGKPAITSMVYNEYHEKEILSFVTPESIEKIYSNVNMAALTKGGKDTFVGLGKWWTSHPHRRDYITATFEPEKPVGEYMTPTGPILNTWEGFAIEPKKGSWKKTRKHLYTILCNKDKKKFKYVMRWLAYCVQNPGKQAEVALIFKGKKGAGKGFFFTKFCKIFGRHGMVLANREQLVGKHNQHLQYCSFLLADEAYHPGDKEAEGIIKNMITEGSLTIEPKFRDLKISKNCLHIAMCTNSDWIIPATEDERRYFINEVDNRWVRGQATDQAREAYFKALWDELDNKDGLSAWLYDLLNVKLGDWHPRNSVPMTSELRKQIQMSLPRVKYSLFALLDDGVFPHTGEVIKKEDRLMYTISSKGLLDYLRELDPASFKNVSVKQVDNLLTELGMTKSRTAVKRFWVLPELGELRDTFNKKISQNTWDTSEKWIISKSDY